MYHSFLFHSLQSILKYDGRWQGRKLSRMIPEFLVKYDFSIPRREEKLAEGGGINKFKFHYVHWDIPKGYSRRDIHLDIGLCSSEVKTDLDTEIWKPWKWWEQCTASEIKYRSLVTINRVGKAHNEGLKSPELKSQKLREENIIWKLHMLQSQKIIGLKKKTSSRNSEHVFKPGLYCKVEVWLQIQAVKV